MEWRNCKKHYLKYQIDRNRGECPACKLEHQLELARKYIPNKYMYLDGTIKDPEVDL